MTKSYTVVLFFIICIHSSHCFSVENQLVIEQKKFRQCDIQFREPTPEIIAAEKAATPKTHSKRLTFKAKIGGENFHIPYQRFSASMPPTKGTIVYLCGGPGLPCTSVDRPPDISDHYDIIVIDYLGVGDNSRFTAPTLMSIESQGDLISQLIRSLGTEKILIFAQSFGTSVGTVAAAKLTDPSNPVSNLVGVVLQGVVGPGHTQPYSKGFAEIGKIAWDLLSSDEKDHFQSQYTSATRLMFADQKKNLDTFLTNILLSGAVKAAKKLKKLNEKLMQEIANSFGKIPRMVSPQDVINHGSGKAMFLAAGCQIFFEETQEPPRIFGKTVRITSLVDMNLCRCATVAQPFAPDQFQIHGVSIVYINGEQDPATPLNLSRSHFDGQKKTAHKLSINVQQTGHLDNLNPKCTNFILRALMESKPDVLNKQIKIMSSGDCNPDALESSLTPDILWTPKTHRSY